MKTTTRALLAGVAATAVVVAGAITYGETRPAPFTITVHFVEAPGLYSGNNVDILGVPIGRVSSITAEPHDVAVVVTLPHGTQVPANAQAVLLAPNPVSDRYVGISPPYSGGPLMQSGASIPVARTTTPVEVDQIYSALDNLAKALGPNGVDKDGSLGDALHVLAQNLSGNGQALHDTITALAQALPALANNTPQLTGLLDNVDTLTRALADHNATVSSFYQDLATATSQLAGEREDLATALASLQTALGQLGVFVQSNRAAIGGNIQNLITVSNSLLANQRQLIETFDVAPLAIANLGATVDTSDPSNPLARIRASLQPGQVALINQYCGSSSLPHVTALGLQPVAGLLGPILGGSTSTGTPWDLLCVTLDAILQEPPAPGAPQIPNLDVAQYVAGAQ